MLPLCVYRPQAAQTQQYAKDLVGAIIDVTYAGPLEETYRVQVKSYNPALAWHKVHSRGLSTWDGDDFTDEIDINAMAAKGRIRVVTSIPSPVNKRSKTIRRRPAASLSGQYQANTKRARGMPIKDDIVGLYGQGGPCAHFLDKVVDLDYGDGSEGGVFRVRVVSFNPATGWYFVDSTGLSLWEGEDFNDEVDLGKMEAEGCVTPVANVIPPFPSKRSENRGKGSELVGRIMDVKVYTTDDRVCRLFIIDYDERRKLHHVEVHTPNVSKDFIVPEWLDIVSLWCDGGARFVDGQDELKTSGHALIGEDVNFLPTEGGGISGASSSGQENEKSEWLKAKIVGWWPQELLPPVAVGCCSGIGGADIRQAVFVAEVNVGDRWQFTLSDALMAVAATSTGLGNALAKDNSSTIRRVLLEVFAGPCELSLACRRLGVHTESYDIHLSSAHDFLSDDGFENRIHDDLPWEMVHFCPPDGDIDRDVVVVGETFLGILDKLYRVITALHGLGHGFVVQCLARSMYPRTDVMKKVMNLFGVYTVNVDLQSFGAAQSTPICLITNSRELIALQVGRRQSTGQRTGDADTSRYPRAFCEAYARALVHGGRTVYQ